MVKAFVDLDGDSNNISGAVNITATGTVRSDTQFKATSNGTTQFVSIGGNTMTFDGGILTASTTGH